MNKLSLVVITKNEATKIGRCLQSCESIVNDIVVLDSGSTDNTENISKGFGARFYTQSWEGFGKQKQKAVSLANNDWVLCLDADEYLGENLQNLIRRLDFGAGQCVAYSMNRCNYFLGRWLRHGEGYPDRMVRLFNRRFAGWSDEAVHEKVICHGTVSHLDADIMHESAETLTRYIEKQNRYTETQARMSPLKSVPVIVFHMVFSPATRFLKHYLLRLGFLDGIPGLIHASIGALSSFLKYLKMYERKRQLEMSSNS